MVIYGDYMRRKPLTDTKDNRGGRRITAKIENGGFAAAEGLERIFLGEDQDYNLAIGPYAKSISTVCSLIGVPQLPRHENPVIQKQRTRLQRLINDEYPVIIKLAMINGTHWPFIRYANRRNIIDHIKDYEIPNGSLRINPISREIDSIVTQRLVYWTPDSFDFFEIQKQAWRKRYFSRDSIVDEFEGKRTEYRNPLHVMPIPFAIDSLGEWRGNSLITPILRLSGDAHRIRANRDEILATYKPNAVVKTDNWGQWVNDNSEAIGISDDDEYDFFKNQVKFCKETEDYDYRALPGGVVADHDLALKDIDTQTALTERLPWIFSGAEPRGSHATSEFGKEQGIFYINEMRSQLYKATYTLENVLNYQDSLVEGIEPEEIEVNYNRMELMSDEQQITVLERGMATIGQMTAGGIPLEIAFSTLKSLFNFRYQTPEEMHDAIRKLKESMPAQDDFSSIIGGFR